MFDSNLDNCSRYLEYAEWLRLTDILDDWCKLDASCKEIKKLAILGACEKQEIEYTRNDGKSFDDPVMELYGRGLLLINKRSFNNWKIKFEQKEQTRITQKNNTATPTNGFLEALSNHDDEYISIESVIDAIHLKIGSQQSLDKVVRILNTAIGQSLTPPTVYKLDDFKGWTPIVLKNAYNGDFKEASNAADQATLETIHYLVSKIAVQRVERQELEDDLPF